jgi:hypothetical protein
MDGYTIYMHSPFQLFTIKELKNPAHRESDGRYSKVGIITSLKTLTVIIVIQIAAGILGRI